ncbi:MAG: hypothetical protein FJZ90_11595, partial [Chloroflexi bacterium]|nr:hypothetical protein [Chloroflexota bacterium]
MAARCTPWPCDNAPARCTTARSGGGAMPRIAVVSDSTPGLAADYVARHQIRIVPLYLKIGDKTYRDGVDITTEEFYRILPT